MQLFVNRNDAYALQETDGQYFKTDSALTVDVLCKHLRGEVTVGCYQLDGNSFCKWLVFDVDPEACSSPEDTARRILQVCFEKQKEPDGVERPRIWPSAVLLEASRYSDPSYHIWILFSLPIPAKVARWFGLRILELANISPKTVELFPKQAEITKDRPYGNLVKLPLGFHRVEKKWSKLLNFETFSPLPSEALLDKFGISFSEGDLAQIMSFEDKKHVQATFDLPKNYKPLKNREEERIVKFLVKYWRKPYRNKLEMAFLGWCIKRGVAFASAKRIIERICDLTRDEEKPSRLHLVDYHYRNRRDMAGQLLGISGLKEIVKEALNEQAA